jgi:methylmalonyl-CoA mutase N-terminal domain/subunit
VDDLHLLFDGIPLDQVSTSMTINATAATLLAMYCVVGEERGVALDRLSGTIQNDILKEYVARGTYIYPPVPSLGLVAETFRFCATRVPNWNPISISGYHMREAGATAVQELAFTVANALAYVDTALAAGIDLEAFAPRLSFFFACHGDLFEEVAKFRAGRRLWARLMRDRYHASDAGARLRFHTQTGGVTLTAQQPLNNVVRVALQALAATLGGTQSLHTNGFDEALALPTAEAATLALRTQQIIAHESGVASTADPLAGSWFVEAMTNAVEERTLALLREVERRGGAVAAIEAGFLQDEIARSAYDWQRAVESGARTVVGVNRFADGAPPPEVTAPDFRALEAEQVGRVRATRERRDAAMTRAALEALRVVATRAGSPDSGFMDALLAAVRARATVGEISDVLQQAFGRYRPS